MPSSKRRDLYLTALMVLAGLLAAGVVLIAAFKNAARFWNH